MRRTLYELEESAHCEMVRLAMRLERLDYTPVRIDPIDRAEVRRLSGQEEVPVLLEEHGAVFHDPQRILRHLAGRIGSRLLPDGRRDQALTWVLVDRADSVLTPICERLIRRREPDGRPLRDDDLRVLERRLDEELGVLEGILERGPFLFGERPTVADVAFHAFLNRLHHFGGRPVPDSLLRASSWYHRVEAAVSALASPST